MWQDVYVFNSILIVCVGNICRSPMAEALLAARAPAGVVVRSAGIGALVGYAAEPDAQELMHARGMDISAHRARQLTLAMAMEADLILVMETRHQQHIHNLVPSTRGKVHLLGKWQDVEVPDPYQKSAAHFAQALELIEQGVDAWAERLWQG